jgi:hypothetical protein
LHLKRIKELHWFNKGKVYVGELIARDSGYVFAYGDDGEWHLAPASSFEPIFASN